MRFLLLSICLAAAGIVMTVAPAAAGNTDKSDLYRQCMEELKGPLRLSCQDIFIKGGVETASGEVLYRVEPGKQGEKGGAASEDLTDAYDAPGSFPENEVLVWSSGLWKVYRVEERYMCYATTQDVSLSRYAPLDTGTAIIEGDMELNLNIPKSHTNGMQDEDRLTAGFFPKGDEAEAYVEAQGNVLVNGEDTLFIVPLPPNEERAREQALIFGYFFQDGDVIEVSFDLDKNGQVETIATYPIPGGGKEAKKQLKLCIDGM